MNTDTQRTVFLSHSSDDHDFIAKLERGLEDAGWHVLVDTEHLRPGDTLPDKILQLIDQAHHVVGVLSPAATESEWVRRELRYAAKTKSQADGHRIVPLLINETTVKQLRDAFEQQEPDGPDDLEDWPLERLGIKVDAGVSALDELLPRLLSALQPVESDRGRRTADKRHVVDALLVLHQSEFRLAQPQHQIGQPRHTRRHGSPLPKNARAR